MQINEQVSVVFDNRHTSC